MPVRSPLCSPLVVEHLHTYLLEAFAIEYFVSHLLSLFSESTNNELNKQRELLIWKCFVNLASNRTATILVHLMPT